MHNKERQLTGKKHH